MEPKTFEEQLLGLAQLQADETEAYKLFLNSVGEDPRQWKSWRDVRPMPVQLFKELEVYRGLVEPKRVWHSSGTTSDKVSKTMLGTTYSYDAAIEDGAETMREVSGYNHNLTKVSLIPNSEQWKNSSLAYMFDELFGSPDISLVKSVTENSFEIDYKKVLSFNEPVIIYGTSYAFVNLMDWLDERDYRGALPAGSMILDTGGYKNRSRSMTRPEFIKLAEEVLGVDRDHMITEYGMSELSNQFWGVSDGWLKPNPGIRTRVVDPVTGKDDPNGVLAIYDADNVWSCCALMTEDLVERREDGSIKVLGRAEGAVAKGCSLVAERALDGEA